MYILNINNKEYKVKEVYIDHDEQQTIVVFEETEDSGKYIHCIDIPQHTFIIEGIVVDVITPLIEYIKDTF